MHPHIHMCMYTHTHTGLGMIRWGGGQILSWGAPVFLSSSFPKPETWQEDLKTSQPRVPGLLGVIQRTWRGLLGVHLAVAQMKAHDPETLISKSQRLSGDVPLVPRTLGENVHPTDPEFCLPNPSCTQFPAAAAGCSPVWALSPEIRVTEGWPGGHVCQHDKHFTLKPSEKGFFNTWADFSDCQTQKISVLLKQPKWG